MAAPARPEDRAPARARVLRRPNLVVALVVVLLASFAVAPWDAPGAVAAVAGAGDLDPTFDDDGLAVTEFGGFVLVDDAAAIEAGPHSGKTLVLGDDHVWRFLPDGSLDTTFDDEGVVTVGPGFQFDGIAVRPDGGFVLVDLFASGCSSGTTISRYEADGQPDLDFGIDGTACVGWSLFRGEDVVVQPDERIVVGGFTWDAVTPSLTFPQSMALVRLSADGTALDAQTIIDPEDGSSLSDNQRALEIVLQSDGAVVLAGVANPLASVPGEEGVRVARLLADDLSLDDAFADNGVASVATPDFDPSRRLSLAITPRQAPSGPEAEVIGVAMATPLPTSPPSIRVLRLAGGPIDFDGSPADPGTFLGEPIDVAFTDPDVSRVEVVDLAPSPGGLLVGADVLGTGGPDRLGLVAVDAVGTEVPEPVIVGRPDGDLSFGVDALATSQLLPRTDGSLGLVGEFIDGETFERQLAQARVLVSGLAPELDPGFGVDGIALTTGGAADEGLAVAVQPDDRRVLVGGTYQFVLRHLEAGPLDPSFGTSVQFDGVTNPSFGVHGLTHASDGAGPVVVVGESLSEGGEGPAAQRLLADGTPDPDFNGGNALVVDVPLDGEALVTDGVFRDVAVQPDGAMVAVGDLEYYDYDANVERQLVLVARILPNGTLDTSFGEDLDGDDVLDGIATIGPVTPPAASQGALRLGQGRGVDLVPDGDVVITGTLPEPEQLDLAALAPLPSSRVLVARFTPDGSRDASFAVGGFSPYGPGVLLDDVAEADGFDRPVLGSVGDSVAIREDGRIGVTGHLDACVPVLSEGACTPLGRLIALQYGPDGTRAGDFAGGDAVIWSPGDEIASRGTGVAFDVLGDMVIGGAVAEEEVPAVPPEDIVQDVVPDDVLVVRLLPDGAFDPTFGSDGIVTTDVGTVDEVASHAGADDAAEDLALAPDGKIVVTGRNADDRSTRVLVARYQPGESVLTCAPDPADFGAFGIGDGDTLTVTCTATDGRVIVDTIGIDPASPHAGDFAAADVTCVGAVLDIGDTCDVDVTFTAGAQGPRMADLVVDGRGPQGPLSTSVGLQGTGLGPPVLEITPDPLVFPLRDAGTASPPGAFTVTNVGETAADLDFALLTGLDVGDFDLPGTGSCFPLGPLAAGASCTIDAVFAPVQAVGTAVRQAQVAVTEGVTGVVSTAGLRGTVVQVHRIVVEPDLVFPARLVSTTSSPLTTTVTNEGDLAAQLALAIVGGNSGAFAIDGTNCGPGPLQPGDSCDVDITFTPGPRVPYDRQSRLRVTNTSAGEAVFADLRGAVIPPAIVLDPEEGPIETEVTVTGSGFESALGVELFMYGRPVGTVPGPQVALGGFETTFTVPEGMPGGPRFVVACQRCGTVREWRARAPFVVTPRLFISPAVGPPGFVPHVEGDGFVPAEDTVLSWSRGIGRTTVVPDGSGEFTTSKLVFHRDQLGGRLVEARPAGDDEVEAAAEAQFLVVPGNSQPSDFAVRR